MRSLLLYEIGYNKKFVSVFTRGEKGPFLTQKLSVLTYMYHLHTIIANLSSSAIHL